MGNMLNTTQPGMDGINIEELRNLCLSERIDIHMTVETVPREKREDSGKEESGQSDLSSNQLVRLQGLLNKQSQQCLMLIEGKEKNKKKHIVIVVDKSGSMAGSPFNQVKTALLEIIGQVITNEYTTVSVILYNNDATVVNFTPQNYKSKIEELAAGGGTRFSVAFQAVLDVIKNEKGRQFEETVVIFMTDGQGENNSISLATAWKKRLQKLCADALVHVIGFSRSHDLELLKQISVCGAAEGFYRYCEPNDGPGAMKDKLKELFDYVSSSVEAPLKFNVSLLDRDNTLVVQGSHSGQVDASIQSSNSENPGESDLLVTTEFWINLRDPESFPEISAEVEITLRKDNTDHKFVVPCIFVEQEKILLEDKTKIALWNIAALVRDVDLLTSQVAKDITAKNVKENLKETLDRLQTKVGKINVYCPEFNKEMRVEIMTNIKDIQAKLDVLHGMLAQYLRGGTEDISLLARAHELRFEAKFSKARRQRLMDRRVAQNFSAVKTDSEQAVNISEEELSTLSKEALQFYFCILSMESVKDLLLDTSELENGIGLGLAVTRPEFALDNPTSLQVWSISGSLVSRSSLMDAFEYKISVDGPLATHGGFSFKPTGHGNIAHATVGAGREPINAWLPLFITPTHWNRVKSFLKQSLGYLCTLDPLGYAYNQLDIFFMVLGHMIGQLTETEVGENQLKLIYALQRTCKACMNDFGKKDDMLQKVSNFLKNPNGRFKNEIPNLFTMIGYVVALPTCDVNNLLGPCVNEEGARKDGKKYKKLWLCIVTELVRRAMSNTDIANDAKVVSVLNLLLNGKGDAGEKIPIPELTHLLGQYSWEMTTNQRDCTLDIPEYDPTDGIVAPKVVIKHSVKVDKAMEFLAQYYCIESQSKKSSAELSEAKGIVKKWVKQVREGAGLALESSKETDTDAGNTQLTDTNAPKETKESETGAELQARGDVSSEMTLLTLKETAKILTQVSQNCFPRLSSIPGCIGFLDYWLSHCGYLDKLEENDPLPSDEWIKGVKKSVQETFSKINDFKKECGKEASQMDDNDFNGRNDDQRGNRPYNSGQDKDYVDDESDEYDDDDDDSHLNQRTGSPMTLPMILSALGIAENQLQFIRALLCQSVSYVSNSQAREAVERGTFVDLTEEGQAINYLATVETDLEERKQAVRNKLSHKAAWEAGNLSMLQAESVWAFIGYLLKTHKDRGEGFKELIDLILNLPNAKKYPLLAEKVLVLLSGRFEDHVVFARGNGWIPELKMSKLFALVLGEEAWTSIERELLSHRDSHVYRESDIPNRQGHCTSNPYISDNVRAAMGLPLLKDLPENPDRRKGKGRRRR